ncbi:MAG: DUF2889 domain-containing protein [Leptospirales bacterium]|nr:DUF2889 domain-containing protein [Leptospirales bacterium]
MIKILEQGAWLNYTNRLGDKELISQAMFLSTHYDCSATLCATSKGYKITQASYSIHRCPDMSKRKEADVPELVGGSGHYDGVKAIRELPDHGDNGKVKELFIEAIRGLDQAETFLLEELGMKTREEYEVRWQNRVKSDPKAYACRPYWNRMPGLEEWSTHIGAYDYTRMKGFYTKYMSYVILQKNESEIIVSGTYNDSFHEMHTELTFDAASRNVNAFDMVVVRAPHVQCHELTHTASEHFIGSSIDNLPKREVGKIIGGEPGCHHLVEIVSTMASAVKEFKGAK